MLENQRKISQGRVPNQHAHPRKSNRSSFRVRVDGKGESVSNSWRQPYDKPEPTPKEKEEGKERQKEVMGGCISKVYQIGIS